MKSLLLSLAIVLICATAASAVSGTGGFAVGAATPKGQANRYTESSFTLIFSGSLDLPGTPGLGLRAAGAGIFLESHEHDVEIGGWDIYTEEYSSNLYTFTVGVELAPPVSALEPYVGSGFGLYYFSNSVKLVDDDHEEVDSKSLSSEASFGYYLAGGLRLYVRPNVAVNVGAHYDVIKNMKHLKTKEVAEQADLESESVDSQYMTYYLGVLFRWP
jgi:opacity protein-like surface antigen